LMQFFCAINQTQKLGALPSQDKADQSEWI